MRPRAAAIAAGAGAILALGLIAAGCGGGAATVTVEAPGANGAPHMGGTQTNMGGTQTDVTSTQTTAGVSSAAVEVQMGDYFFDPQDASAAAGAVEITAPNVGQLPHELVLAKTNDDPAKLPTTSDGSVDEDKLDSPGEVSEIEAGATGTATIDLKPGTYAMFCNIPGHYQQGMYGSLTVN